MANLNFAHSSAPLKTIKEIQFGLFSPEEVKEMSIGQIVYPETMVCSDISLRNPRREINAC
jgi:DNA-directed RNA polymerase II subunit RPB1